MAHSSLPSAYATPFTSGVYYVSFYHEKICSTTEKFSPIKVTPRAYYWTDATGSNNAEALYKARPKATVEVVEAPKGKQVFAEANGAGTLKAISKKATDPVKLFKYLNWMSTPEGAEMITYGVPSKDFTYDKATNTIV
jgi:hypothetical protein